MLIVCLSGTAQVKDIRGTVMDSLTKTPLPGVTVCTKSSSKCALTNNDGKFLISVKTNEKKVTFTAAGYHPWTLALTDSLEQEAVVQMSKSYATLKEVTVNARKKKYRNKNNPAVELIRLVIANKSKNGPGAYPSISYRQYEKTRMSLINPPMPLMRSWPLKKFQFLFNNIDSTLIPGQKLIPLYLEEILSQNYRKDEPSKKKQIILGKKSVDYGEYVDMRGIHLVLNRMYEDINIYDNKISIFTTQFLSPVADLAPAFYMYFIEDTIIENNVKLIKLYFTPRNPEDLLFQGTLYITLDGNYAVRKLEMGVSKHVNIDWVHNFKVTQDFEKGPGGHYYLAGSDMIALLSPFERSFAIHGERILSISQLSDTVLPDLVFRGPPVDSLPEYSTQSPSSWNNKRPVPLSQAEENTYMNTDSLMKMKSYKRIMDWSTVLSVGYKSAGNFDIGQIGDFYSFNPVEGQRLLFGGRTNSGFNKSFYLASFLAYGFKDEQWKYNLTGTYAFNHQSIYKFPFNYLQVSYTRDTRNPGQENVFEQGTAFLSSFARGNNAMWLYNDIGRLSYVREFSNHLNYVLSMRYWKQLPAAPLYFVYTPPAGQSDTAHQIQVADISATLRWAPHEEFIENKTSRSDITNRYPIFTLQYVKGIKGFLEGQYNYDAFHLEIFKRFYLAPLGYTDVTFDAGYLSGKLPFPLLTIPPVNLSVFYSYSAYNMMNTEEFVYDHYGGVDIEHYFNGFFFNKIPLLKKLRFREVIAGKILWGGLRDLNNPDKNPDQMKFPLINNVVSTYPLGNIPYLEASVGVFNILSIFRIDLVKRFTYLDHPHIPTLALRISANFNF
jgi:hypothetical protein